MKITVCEFPDDAGAAGAAWDRLAQVLAAAPTDLLVLPELADGDSFWESPDFDEAIWHRAVDRHALLPEQLRRLAARRVLGTRAVERDGQRLNETFLWTPERGLVPGRTKAWLPQQHKGWEETWFDHGPPVVEPVDDDGLRFAMLVCTELIVSGAPRELGKAGVQLIAAPRATGGHRRWEIATQMAALSAGAFVATANRRGGGLAGGSWIVGPDGEELARTGAATPIVTIEVDLAEADNAKATYPRTVREPPAKGGALA